MWNDLSLKNPDHDICEYGKKDAATLEKLPDLISLLTTSAELLTEDHPIWDEILVFKNIQAKYKRILHCDKCLQLLQRVGGCVKKMVLLNLSKVYLDLGEKFLKEMQKSSSSTYFLPSQQQLEYVLIRTQSAAKLLCEALHYSRETFCFLIQKLKVGHLILNLMMATSITARLNIVFKGLLVQLFDMYKKLYPWRKCLRRGGWKWSKTLKLPDDLEIWINLEESEHLKPKHLPKEQLDFLSTIFDENNPESDPQNISSLVNDDVVFLENAESVENNEMNEESECVLIDEVPFDTIIDNGVPITRSESIGGCFPNSELITSTPPKKGKKNRNLTNEELRTPSTTPEKGKSNPNLANEKEKLLKKIKEAKDMKTLKLIWNNLDITNKDIIPKGLTAEKIRLIEKVFLRLKRGISEVNKSILSDPEKEAEAKVLVKVAGIKLTKHLNIMPEKNITSKKTIGNNKLEPVRTMKELKGLYETLYLRLQAAQKYKKCAKLKKVYKSRNADIKLLEENGEKGPAKKLIYSSSKLFLAKFLN